MPQLIWLVTGCSSGFGEQFVQSIINRGDKVIATARNLSKILHLQQTGAATLQLDITDAGQSLSSTINKAIAIYGRIDVLVNNAGFITIGSWADLSHEDWLAQFNTNLFGTIKLTRALLPHFTQRRSGTLAFISSLSGWIGHGYCGAYAASKFALEGAVEALRNETANLGIKTLIMEPGRFRTLLLSSNNLKASRSTESRPAEYEEKLEGLGKEDQRQPGDPKKFVEITIDVVREEGFAKGREVPFRLPLGIDCYDDVKSKCEETLRLLEEWKDVTTSTDFDD
ncbi:hypothetical protein BDV96DRAFT_506887 [Lophiotrema nucula]|uniref:NAD(P)-binding protein n=1 Tax=Lophiotrema nucula TaxID=690887 RepID=A0A6A5YIK3_9PLEO|nr:hypothetical protein BDV96DRAFT_506887 [Lophiotrema nucula]